MALLRDLWRWQHPLGVDAATERAVRGDVSLAGDLDGVDAEAASELMRVAAAYGRWDLVAALVEAGVSVPVEGTTPLHHAAGAGELGLVQRLVAHGADVTVRDPTYHAPPVEWARFLRHPEVVEWLEARLSQ